MTESNKITESTAQTVVFLETLAELVEKSPVTYSSDAAKDLAAHIRGMADVVNIEARVNPAVLETTRQYGALDWHNEIIAVLFAREHRAAMN